MSAQGLKVQLFPPKVADMNPMENLCMGHTDEEGVYWNDDLHEREVSTCCDRGGLGYDSRRQVFASEPREFHDRQAEASH